MQEGDPKSPILLVEGDSIDELRTVRAYNETGHSNRLLVARSCEHAMTLLKACARGLRFGLVLLDMYAPRFGAADLIGRIRSEPSLGNVPVVVLAPWSEQEHAARAVAARANTWVRKPESQFEYCKLLDRLMNLFLGVKQKDACKEQTA